MFLILFSRLTGRLTQMILILWTALFGGSAAAGISSKDWRRWSSGASPDQLLEYNQSRANRWCYWTVVQTTIIGRSLSW